MINPPQQADISPFQVQAGQSPNFQQAFHAVSDKVYSSLSEYTRR